MACWKPIGRTSFWSFSVVTTDCAGFHPARLKTIWPVIEEGKASGAKVVLMQVRLPPNLGPVYIERFEAIYPRLAEEYDVELLPFFLDDIFDQPGMLMDDGIHPTAEAQPQMLETLWPRLKALLE